MECAVACPVCPCQRNERAARRATRCGDGFRTCWARGWRRVKGEQLLAQNDQVQRSMLRVELSEDAMRGGSHGRDPEGQSITPRDVALGSVGPRDRLRRDDGGEAG